MRKQVDATFQVTAWDEAPYDEAEGAPRLTRASVAKTFTGGIAGEGRVEYLMTHRADGTASFVGTERVTGRIGDREGSFVLHHDGVFEGGAASADCTVVANSGTAGLAGISGHGRYAATGREADFTLDYDFD